MYVLKHHITSHHITPSDVLQFVATMYCCFFPVLLPRSEQQHQLSKKVRSVVRGNNSSVSSKSKQVDAIAI
jgi:hypothetical protein